MSVEVQNALWTLEMSPTQKLVLIALAKHAWDDGTHAFPSNGLLAAITGLNEKSVRRALVQLREWGLIVRTRVGKQHYSDTYSVDFVTVDKFPRVDTPSQRPEPQSGLSVPQSGLSVPPERAQCPTNSQEQSYEEKATITEISVPMPKDFRTSLGLRKVTS